MRQISSAIGIACTVALAVLSPTTALQAHSALLSMSGREAPPVKAVSKLSAPVASFADAPDFGSVTLAPPSQAEQIRAKAAEQRTTIGFGRIPRPEDGVVRVDVPAGETRARISVKSSTAKSLRVGFLLGDDVAYSIASWRPGDENAFLLNTLAPHGQVVWSPLTVGELQDVVVTRQVDDGRPWSFVIAAVSHITEDVLFINPTTSDLKSLGESASCQIDVACLMPLLTSNQQNELAGATRAVTLMIMTFRDGTSAQCTGTLLNTASYPDAIILTANHCVSAGLSGLTTLWLYSRPLCDGGPPANYIQLPTGGRVVWQSATFDGALLRLDQIPPSPVSYAGWDANQVPAGTYALAIHHPMGDAKKATFGTTLGSNTQPILVTELGTFAPGAFYEVNWGFGIVEHGSSGSGVFTEAPDLSLRLRGTLTTGSTSCSASPRLAEYSKLYNMYPTLGSYLNTPITPIPSSPTPTPTPTPPTPPAPSITPAIGLWWNPNESGSGYALDFKHGVLVVTIYSYKPNGDPQWYLASGPLNGNVFTSSLDKFSFGQCISCAYNGLPSSAGNDGYITITFTSATSATIQLPGGRVTTIQPQAF